MNAYHPDSTFHARSKFSKNSKHCTTEQKAPKSTRNSPSTPPNLVGPQRLLSDASFHYSSVDTTRGSKSTCCTNQPKLFRTHPDRSEHRRTTTKTYKTDSETLQCQLSAGKLLRKKAFSTKFNFQQAHCPNLPSPFRAPTDETCKKHAR